MKDAPLIETRVCQYENTPDSHLIIDRHPAAKNIWLVGGGSGHGFKHQPKDKLFVFVTRRDVPPTNNVSEQRLRPSVIFRKVTNGFRSAWGAQGYAAVCSVTATGVLRGLTAVAAIRTCLAGGSVLTAH